MALKSPFGAVNHRDCGLKMVLIDNQASTQRSPQRSNLNHTSPLAGCSVSVTRAVQHAVLAIRQVESICATSPEVNRPLTGGWERYPSLSTSQIGSVTEWNRFDRLGVSGRKREWQRYEYGQSHGVRHEHKDE